MEATKRRYCDTGNTCNFSKWLQFFAFDVIGQLTWSKRIGFVDRAEDIDGIIEFVGDFLAYASVVGQMPQVDLFLEKNPVKLQLQKWGFYNKVFAVTKFALDQNKDRTAEMEKIKRDGIVDEESGKGVDLLTKFTQAAYNHPEFMTDVSSPIAVRILYIENFANIAIYPMQKQVLASCTSMIFAGSETTAISLSSVFQNLLANPRVYKKLIEELDQAKETGVIADRENNKVTWAEAQQLKYLDAVIQESFRKLP